MVGDGHLLSDEYSWFGMMADIKQPDNISSVWPTMPGRKPKERRQTGRKPENYRDPDARKRQRRPDDDEPHQVDEYV